MNPRRNASHGPPSAITASAAPRIVGGVVPGREN